jgi:hypothetical protein
MRNHITDVSVNISNIKIHSRPYLRIYKSQNYVAKLKPIKIC